ncbi:MAG: acyl-CoA reductase, partial [Bacillota bacterium]
DTLKIFADIADGIVVWGGDEAINAARSMAGPNTKLIEWGHKLSFAYADSNATDEDLKGLAKNIVTTNQLLCSSAQGIYVDTNDRETLDRFAKRFFNILYEVSHAHQPVPYGMKSKNAVELYYEEMVKEDTGKRIYKKDGVSVITSDDSTLELSMLFRNVWVKMLPCDSIVKTLKPYKNYLQTASILSEKSYDTYVEKLIKAGVVRIKKPEEMSETLLGESHDGMYPLRLYTKIAEIYKSAG